MNEKKKRCHWCKKAIREEVGCPANIDLLNDPFQIGIGVPPPCKGNDFVPIDP